MLKGVGFQHKGQQENVENDEKSMPRSCATRDLKVSPKLSQYETQDTEYFDGSLS